jgi:hypothetical protein
VASPDWLARLEAQRAHFASDDHVREEVRIWAGTSPEERLRELDAMSAENELMLGRIDEAMLARIRELRGPSPDAEAILAGMRKASR